MLPIEATTDLTKKEFLKAGLIVLFSNKKYWAQRVGIAILLAAILPAFTQDNTADFKLAFALVAVWVLIDLLRWFLQTNKKVSSDRVMFHYIFDSEKVRIESPVRQLDIALSYFTGFTETKNYFGLAVGNKGQCLVSKTAMSGQQRQLIRELFRNARIRERNVPIIGNTAGTQPGGLVEARKRRSWVIPVSIVIGLLALIGLYTTGESLKSFYRSMKVFFTDNGEITNTIPREFTDLFTADGSGKLHDFSSYSGKIMNTITYLKYDSDYQVFLLKMNLSADLPVSSLIEDGRGKIYGPGGGFKIVEGYFFTLHARIDTAALLSNIYLSTEADSILVFKNDSAACYYLRSDNFSLRYGRDGVVGYYTEQNHEDAEHRNIPKALFFKKIGTILYLMVWSPGKPGVSFSKEIALQLIRRAIR